MDGWATLTIVGGGVGIGDVRVKCGRSFAILIIFLPKLRKLKTKMSFRNGERYAAVIAACALQFDFSWYFFIIRK